MGSGSNRPFHFTYFLLGCGIIDTAFLLEYHQSQNVKYPVTLCRTKHLFCLLFFEHTIETMETGTILFVVRL